MQEQRLGRHLEAQRVRSQKTVQTHAGWSRQLFDEHPLTPGDETRVELHHFEDVRHQAFEPLRFLGDGRHALALRQRQ